MEEEKNNAARKAAAEAMKALSEKMLDMTPAEQFEVIQGVHANAVATDAAVFGIMGHVISELAKDRNALIETMREDGNCDDCRYVHDCPLEKRGQILVDCTSCDEDCRCAECFQSEGENMKNWTWKGREK